MTENPYNAPELGSVGGNSHVWRARALKAFGAFVVLGIVFALVAPAIRFSSRGSTRAQCINNLKQICLGLRNYESQYGAFPPAYTVDENGNRLHSWRALILPFMEQQALYATIDFSKPWDDPANRKAFERDLLCYQCPAADCPEGHTNYFVVVAPDGVFSGTESRELDKITDKQETVLLAIEAEATKHVHWMSPNDVDEAWLHSIGKIDKLPHGERLVGVALNGRYVLLDSDMTPQQLRAMITIAGGDNENVPPLE